jgi:hypothetical protein
MFRTLKYINHAHRHFYARMPVSNAAKQLVTENFPEVRLTGSARDLLYALRDIQGGKGLIPPQR